jgi:RNA polymerase sigma-70 factor (ECF subfamily)
MFVMSRQQGKALDDYLVVATAAGDRHAAELLVRRWQRKLVGHAYRLTGDVEASRDVAQYAWSEIMRGINRLRDERAFPAWAFRIVSRGCAQHVRQLVRQREVTEVTLAEDPQASSEDPGFSIEIQRLRAAIRTLPREQAAAIALYYLEELSVAEVAVALDVPSGTVKTRLMHARRKLRALLEGED